MTLSTAPPVKKSAAQRAAERKAQMEARKGERKGKGAMKLTAKKVPQDELSFDGW